MKHTRSRTLGRFVLVAALLFVLAGLAPSSVLAQGDPSYTGLSNRDVAGASYAQPASNVTANVVYTVKRGDTLAKIAARYGVTVQALLVANPGINNPNRIYIGQRVVIPSSSPAKSMEVKIYLIALEGGSVGCGDQVIAVTRNVPATTAPLTAALNQLLSIHTYNYGQSGLVDPLYQSHLAIKRITSSGTTWNIYLEGSMALGGTCDDPRVEAQLTRTALQFSTVKQVNYFINGVPLKSVLSEK